MRCKATGKLEFIAAQCRYGEKKDAGGLKLQGKAKKDNFGDMQNVLLQICSESEGWQSFTNKTWARRQEEKKYSLMSCETIIAQLDYHCAAWCEWLVESKTINQSRGNPQILKSLLFQSRLRFLAAYLQGTSRLQRSLAPKCDVREQLCDSARLLVRAFCFPRF